MDLAETVTKMAEKVVQLTETAKLDGLFNGIQWFIECVAAVNKGSVILDAMTADKKSKITSEWELLKNQGLPEGAAAEGDAAIQAVCEQLDLLCATLKRTTQPANYEFGQINAKLDRILHAQSRDQRD